MSSSPGRLAEIFQRAFERPSRRHQVAAAAELLHEVGRGSRKLLVQHAPGSGKTELIGLLAFEALRQQTFDYVVVLNHALDLEEQAMARLAPCWRNLAGIHGVHAKRIGSCEEIRRTLRRNCVHFAMLQKFGEAGGASDDDEETAAQHVAEHSAKILVIIDEAHRGIPEEGSHMKAVEARYGSGHTQVLLTATPKPETLLSHGLKLGDGRYVAHHCHSQREAVAGRHVLSPLEHYTSCVPQLQVNGKRLCDMADPVSIDTFLEQLSTQRDTKAIMRQRAHIVMESMPKVYTSSPVMTQRNHQIKAMVILPSIQAVYDFGQLLKTVARGKKTALGKPFAIGTFFSSHAEKRTGDNVSMVSEHEANKGLTPADCDIIVTCRKYVTGYDEWRICAIFLATRISQPEFLQQVLGRATRARPGEGKRRPLVMDLANNPDHIFSAVMRFWDKTCHYPEPLGELRTLQEYITSFAGVGDGSQKSSSQASLVAARRLPIADQVLLRAAIISYLKAASSVRSAQTPVKFEWLFEVLKGLNLELKDQLFGGSTALAEAAATESARGQEPRAASASAAGRPGVAPISAATVPAALRRLRGALELGRRRRPRRDAPAAAAAAAPAAVAPTPEPKRRRGAAGPEEEAAEEGLATPLKGPAVGNEVSPAASFASTPAAAGPLAVAPRPAVSDFEAIRDGLDEAIEDVATRFRKSLPKHGDVDTIDRRASELERFEFASAPLRKFSTKAVIAACLKLSRRLDRAFGESLKEWLARQKVACERTFLERLPELGSREVAQLALDTSCSEFEDVSSFVGGRVTGALRSGLHRKLARKLHEVFPLQEQ